MKDRLDAAMLAPRARRATRPFRRGRCMTEEDVRHRHGRTSRAAHVVDWTRKPAGWQAEPDFGNALISVQMGETKPLRYPCSASGVSEWTRGARPSRHRGLLSDAIEE